MVYLAGIAYYDIAGNAGDGVSLFQLQEGWRPAETLEIPITIRNSTPTLYAGYLMITTTGYICVINHTAGAGIKQVALDGVSFLVQ